MTIPYAVAGQWPTREQQKAVEAYGQAHPGLFKAGMVVTANLANEAIAWFNERNDTTQAPEPRYSWVVRNSDDEPWVLLTYRWISRKDTLECTEHWFHHWNQVKAVEVLGEDWREIQ